MSASKITGDVIAVVFDRDSDQFFACRNRSEVEFFSGVIEGWDDRPVVFYRDEPTGMSSTITGTVHGTVVQAGRIVGGVRL